MCTQMRAPVEKVDVLGWNKSDEACIMKDVGINIITIGADDRKNHENILADR